MRTGTVTTIAYRLHEPKKPAKGGSGADLVGTDDTTDAPARARPDLTQKGVAMVGDLRTGALHQALREATIDDSTLMALLVLALSGLNVSIQSGLYLGQYDVEDIRATITEGDVLTAEPDKVRSAARAMLTAALSCRDNASNSGVVARIAGEAIGASLHLPTMATEEFLSCLSRGALETAAKAEEVKLGRRVKDTRANFVERFATTSYVYPAALFKLAPGETVPRRIGQFVRGNAAPADDDGSDDAAEPDGSEPDEFGPDHAGLAEAAD